MIYRHGFSCPAPLKSRERERENEKERQRERERDRENIHQERTAAFPVETFLLVFFLSFY